MSDTNPYTPPQSNIYQPPTGGNQRDPNWDLGSVLSEAWAKTNGFKLTYFIAIVIYVVISMVVNGIISFIGGESLIIGLLGQILVMLITYPLAAGLMMMGIKRARGQDVQPTMIFDYYPQTIPVFLLNLLMIVLIAIGLVLLVLPGIYLAFAYMLAVPLLVDKNLGVWTALETSRKAVTPCWFRVFGLMIVLILILIVSAIPFGIGLIWTLPLCALVLGVLYRNLVGDEA
jgi:uncharacterized membrane protein